MVFALQSKIMRIKISKAQLPNPELSIRRCGYGIVFDRRGGIKSFARRLDRGLYPRFHLYLEENGGDWELNIHLDQRAPVYAGVTAHSGEYDGEALEREAARIKELLK